MGSGGLGGGGISRAGTGLTGDGIGVAGWLLLTAGATAVGVGAAAGFAKGGATILGAVATDVACVDVAGDSVWVRAADGSFFVAPVAVFVGMAASGGLAGGAVSVLHPPASNAPPSRIVRNAWLTAMLPFDKKEK